MKNVLSRIGQIVLDVVVGVAIYFALQTFVPVVSDNVIVVITLIATAVFAETLEVRLKK